MFIAPDSPARQSLSIYVLANPENIEKSADDATTTVAATEPTKPTTTISDLTAFKLTKQLYPMAKPYITICPKGAKSKL